MTTVLGAEPLDGAALLANLAAWWATHELSAPRPPDLPMPATGAGMLAYMAARRESPERIAGGKWDQPVPEGTQNPYWEIIRQLPLDPGPSLPWHHGPEPVLHWMGSGREDFTMFADRFAICPTYSWGICSPGDIAWLKDVLGGRGVVECGAGGGYWAWQMRQSGIDAVAYDPNAAGPGNCFVRRTWSTVVPGDQSASRHHPGRALFLCWPSYADPWAAQSLACYTGDLLVYCGEGEGGCTADYSFFRLLDAEWEEVADSAAHVSYWGIRDRLTAYRRKT